jgi:Na+/proline symporter
MQSKRATRMAIGYSFFFQACIGVGVLLFGLSMRVAMPQLPTPDLATPVLGMSILPPWIGLLVLRGAVVTFTRTGGAILLTVASAVSHDIYVELINPAASERARVLASRLAVVTFSAIPVALALRQLDLVNFIVIWAAKLMVSFLFIPVVVGLNWRRATRAGAIASMLGGMVTCLAWSRFGSPYFLGLDPAEAGVVVSAALMFTVSLGNDVTRIRRDIATILRRSAREGRVGIVAAPEARGVSVVLPASQMAREPRHGRSARSRGRRDPRS